MFKNNLKKIDIVKDISVRTGFPINLSKKLFDDLIDALIEHIKKDNFNLKNVELFKILYKKERKGRNPKTKEEFLVSSRRSISFTPSKLISKNLDKLI